MLKLAHQLERGGLDLNGCQARVPLQQVQRGQRCLIFPSHRFQVSRITEAVQKALGLLAGFGARGFEGKPDERFLEVHQEDRNPRRGVGDGDLQRQGRFALAGLRPQRMYPGLESAEQAIQAEEAGGDSNSRPSFLDGLPARGDLLEDLGDERGERLGLRRGRRLDPLPEPGELPIQAGDEVGR